MRLALPPSMVEVGEVAPDFTLPNEKNEDVTLSKEIGGGPIVLSWYVLDFTNVCTGQACDFRDEMKDLAALGAKVFGISTDSPASHRSSRRRTTFRTRS